MKKLMAGMLVAVAAIIASAAPSYAFVSTGKVRVKATATTGGTNQAAFTLSARSVVGNVVQGTTTITFPSVDPLSAGWTLGQQYLVINATVTDVGGGVKIYTDNTSAVAVPKFVAPTTVSTAPTSVAAGLLKGTSGTTSVAPLPMAWTIKAAVATPAAANPQNAGDPNSFQWLNVTDAANWSSGTDFNGDGDVVDAGDSAPLALNAKFPTMISNVGIHFGQADTEFGAHPDGQDAYIYVEANFAGAEVLTSYQTTALTIESYIN